MEAIGIALACMFVTAPLVIGWVNACRDDKELKKELEKKV